MSKIAKIQSLLNEQDDMGRPSSRDFKEYRLFLDNLRITLDKYEKEEIELSDAKKDLKSDMDKFHSRLKKVGLM